jgi:transposase-like protein
MYTKEQIEIIQRNKNVIRCSSTTITYTKEFKLSAIESYFENGYGPKMIFEDAGFDLDVIGRKKPKACLSRWRKKYKERGKQGLIHNDKNRPGRKKKLEFKTKDEEIKYLKAKIEYMNAENDFLAKLRGLKRE